MDIYYYYLLIAPSGCQNVFCCPVPHLDGFTKNFLDQHIDRYGRVVLYNHEMSGTVARIKTVADIDGRTNTLAYTNTAKPHLITSVTDPYGRKAYFGYSTTVLLTNITDTSGMSASIAYGT